MKLLSRFRPSSPPPDNPVPQLLTGWGRTAPTLAQVTRPESLEILQNLVTGPHLRGLIARGLGRSYGDPAQNAGGSVIDMTGLNGVRAIDLESGAVTVEAGVSIHRLLQLFVPLGLFVPVTPGTRYVTVGGALASDIHGKNHHVDGAFSNHVTAIELMLASGESMQIDRASHADLFQATCGGMGLTGLILAATVQMIPIETSLVAVDTDRAANIDELLALMLSGDDAYRYSVAWVDTLARGRALGRGVLYRGNHLSRREVDENFRGELLTGPRSSPLAVPNVVPGGLVGLKTARMFNQFWYRKHPLAERQRPQQLSSFFHQLDMLEHTNRVYGGHGFVQHQCVLPDGQEPALLQILELLSGAQVPTYLVVLKRMGPGNGMLSFPISGWTLAVDIPAGWSGLSELLDDIDELVVAAGGRLYFAKDSRMRPEHVPAMYPQLSSWRAIAETYDPQRLFVSDLSRRLRLRGGMHE